jgi:DNA-binding transcriptional LysR family regulator
MNPRELDLNLLTVLHILFEEKHVSRTARRLNISQPAVSASLARLRDYFSDPLFFRAGQGLLPTAYAESLREAVCSAMQLIDAQILHSRRFDPLNTSCTFTVCTSDIGEAVCMRPLLLRLNWEAPGCGLNSVAAPPKNLTDLMSHGEVDVALGYFPDLADKCFHSEHLGFDSLTCLLRKDHPIVGTDLTLDQFQRLEHLVVTHEGRRADEYERLISEQSIDRNVRARISHFTNVPALLATTDLVAVVPHSLAHLYCDIYPLKTAQLPFSGGDIELKLYWHQRVHQDSANIWFRDLLISMFRSYEFPHNRLDSSAIAADVALHPREVQPSRSRPATGPATHPAIAHLR